MQFTDEQQQYIDEHYQLLPKDADGECIHIGDVMECCSRVFEVVGLSKTQTFCFCNGRILNFDVKAIRHHKPPTVEDVLEDALNKAASLDRKGGYWPSAADIANIVGEIAPKLQLREAE